MKNKLTLLLVLALILSLMFVFTSCGKNSDTDTHTNKETITQKRDDNDINDENPSTDSESDTNNVTDTQKPSVDLSKYSTLVQELLTNQEYADLLHKGKIGYTSLNSAIFDPHPYTFLEEQGHDVEKVKKGEYECRTQAFVKPSEPNNLYIATYIENEGSYFTEYMLKYTLTDKEMADYQTFHEKKYYQMVFLNDWISANKPAIIISRINVDIDTHKGLAKTIRRKDTVKQDLNINPDPTYAGDLFLIFSSYDAETRLFSAFACEQIFDPLNVIHTSKFAEIPMLAWANYSFDGNKIYFSSYEKANFTIYSAENVETIKIYYTQGTDLTSNSTNLKDALAK